MQNDLKAEIDTHLQELRALLQQSSTYAVAGYCLAYSLHTANSGQSSDERLSSPGRQIPFLLGVLLSSNEPTEPEQFGEAEWQRTTALLERLFKAYLRLYFPTKAEAGTRDEQWHRVREVSMLAFFEYFHEGMLASTSQVADRIVEYLAPFDEEIEEAVGIGATQALEICRWISKRCQTEVDNLIEIASAERKARSDLLDEFEAARWSVEMLRSAAQESGYAKEAEALLFALRGFGTVSLQPLRAAFPMEACAFWQAFSVRRGDGPAIDYPTDPSIFETQPLILLGADKAFCPIINNLFTAVLITGERALLHGAAQRRYLRARDRTLEREVRERIRPFFNSNAKIWSGAFETATRQFEHDVIALDDNLCLIVEAKASPPVKPLRDPERAFVRIRDAFGAPSGIQGGFEQANRIVRRLRSGEPVALYDKHGREIDRILPSPSRFVAAVCVTRENFGALATNLSLLLKKSDADAYPWVINVLDLDSVAQAWSHFKLSSAEFKTYLRQRIALHGKAFSDDELVFAGFFMRHGSFDALIESNAKLVYLNPDYSDVFDEIYRHLHWCGPPVELNQTEPVAVDLKRSLQLSRTVLWNDSNSGPRQRSKIGRNERCPCGSGAKYKRCCGARG